MSGSKHEVGFSVFLINLVSSTVSICEKDTCSIDYRNMCYLKFNPFIPNCIMAQIKDD